MVFVKKKGCLPSTGLLFSLLLPTLVMGLAASPKTASAYVLEGTSWPAGSNVNFQVGLGSAGRTLIDGNTSWDAAAAPSLSAWNAVMARLHFSGTLGAHPAVSSGDGVNAVVFARTIFGQTFGSSTLAVTYYRSSGSVTTEADILFNVAQAFDSYRGPLRYGSNGYAVGDIRRVFLHELGHALGLDHPDEHGQHVDAIMNSVTSNRETLSADDIAGAQFMYGAPAPPSPTPTPIPSASGTSRFVNISTRMHVGAGDYVAIGGFIVSGNQSKTVLARALGPTLGSLGVPNALADPVLELHNASGAIIASNDDWRTSSQAAQISASGYAPANSNEAALMATLAPGSYTAIVRGYSNSVGNALVEVYVTDSTSSYLSNISTRGLVGLGNNVMIGGVIVSGGSQKRLIVRALGPTLAAPPASLAGTLHDPTLELRDASGNLIIANDDWTTGTQAQEISRSGYAPANGIESAVMATLIPGNYTAIVRGYGDTTGIALVEMYDLDP